MSGAKVVVQFIAADVGGRTMPACLTQKYRPHFRVGSGEYLGVVFSGDESSEPIQPGICMNADVRFVYAPNVDYGDLVVGAQFQILEGARIVGVGVISELVT
jgi:translation elongation factor EF-Tu-like GTPase